MTLLCLCDYLSRTSYPQAQWTTLQCCEYVRYDVCGVDSTMTRVLVVEDEETFRDALSYLLSREGYEVILAADGAEGLSQFEASNPDIVLLDLMMPELPGTEVCRIIRQTSSIPIIMLTAKDSEIDKVVGLELGADDYITKPFSTRELVARIRAVLRRGAVTFDDDEEGAIIESGMIQVDLQRYTVRVNGTEIAMPLKEFELLCILMRNEGRVLTRAQLLDRIWGSDYVGDGKTLDVHIKRLRSKIEVDSADPVHVTTVRGVGYRYTA